MAGRLRQATYLAACLLLALSEVCCPSPVVRARHDLQVHDVTSDPSPHSRILRPDVVGSRYRSDRQDRPHNQPLYPPEAATVPADPSASHSSRYRGDRRDKPHNQPPYLIEAATVQEENTGERRERLVKQSGRSSTHHVPESAGIAAWCPPRCTCDIDVTKVNCSSLGLSEYPKLPPMVKLLYLRNNSIQTLNQTNLAQTPALETLDLSRNKLTSIPAEVFALTHTLTSLDLSKNELSSLRTESFSGLTNLSVLRLSWNPRLVQLNASTFEKLSALHTLDLSRCSLVSLVDHTFRGLGNLQSLDLTRNKLRYDNSTFADKAFVGLPSLTTLNLQGNSRPYGQEGDLGLRYPDVALSTLRNLQKILLDGVPRAPFGPGFANLTKLSKIVFNHFRMYCWLGDIPADMFVSLRGTRSPLTLILKYCRIQGVSPEAFEPIPNIDTLDFTKNPGMGFYNASLGLARSNLTHLTLASTFSDSKRTNHLSHELIRHLQNTPLRTLDFTHNRIATVDYLVPMCLPPTLETLDLSWNYILDATFGIFLFCMPSIRVLDISHQIHFHSQNPVSNESSAQPPTVASSVGDRHEPQSILADGFVCPDDLSTSVLVRPDIWDFPIHCHCPRHVDAQEREERVGERANTTLLNNNSATGADLEMSKSVDVRPVLQSHKEPTLLPNGFKTASRKIQRTRFTSKSDRHVALSFPMTFPATLEVLLGSDMNLKYSIPAIKLPLPNSLRHLEYATNGAFCFGGPFENVPHVEYLDLSENKCRVINPDFFQTWTNVSTLLLNLNTLGRALSEDDEGRIFSPLSRLRRLELRQNLIGQLPPKTFLGNPSLETINLSQNFLTILDLDLSNQRELRVLNLSENGQLRGFTDAMTAQLPRMASHLKLVLGGVMLSCDCRYLRFLRFLCDNPHVVVVGPGTLSCQLPDYFAYERKGFPAFCDDLPSVYRGCLAQDSFTGILIGFCLMTSSLLLAGVVVRYKWKLTYLFYIGRQRLHIGDEPLAYQCVADVFLTYDREDEDIRALVQTTFLPRLEAKGLNVIIGERDFPGGYEVNHISGAIVGSKRTLVLLSREIFQDALREFEFNMAVMYEMNTRKQLLVVVFLDRDLALLNCYPPEVVSFLDSQHERCLHMDADDDDDNNGEFWERLLAELTPQA